jgi:hypothetical protein
MLITYSETVLAAIKAHFEAGFKEKGQTILKEEETTEKIRMMEPITEEEYSQAFALIGRKKAPGISGITTEMIENAPENITTWLINNMNKWIEKRELPKIILKGQIWLIPKSSRSSDFRDTRPINLIEIGRKIFAKIFQLRMAARTTHLEKENNFGFKNKTGTNEPILILRKIIENSKASKKKICLVL